MKITIINKEDLIKYLTENLETYFNANYNGKHLVFKDKICFNINVL